MQEAERVVPRRALVEGRVAQQPRGGVDSVAPALGQRSEFLDECGVAETVRDARGAPVAEREVERVAHGVDDAALQEVLPVGAAQVVVHVHERPVPVDAGQAQLAEIGEEGVSERAALPRESVAAPRHAVADREVPLLRADREHGVRELDAALGEERRDERQLRAVDVPHGADVEGEGAVDGPERALVQGEARLDERVVHRGREDGAALGARRGDLDAAEVLAPGLLGRLVPVGEAGGPVAAVGAQVALGLLDAAHRESETQFDRLAVAHGPRPHEPEGAQGRGAYRVKVEARSAVHEPSVVPEQLPPVPRVALDVHGERRALHDDLALRDPGGDGVQLRAQRNRLAVRDGEAAEREVDHEARVAVPGEGVAVHGALGPHGELGAHARAERGGVAAGGGLLVAQRPRAAERVERLEHGRDAEVVVVLANRPRAALLEVREAAREGLVVEAGRQALGAEVVLPVSRGVGA